MKRQLYLILGILVIFLLLVSACGKAAATPDLQTTMAVKVAVEQTAAILQTQAAQTISAFEALHPSETPTPTSTATPKYTATPDKVIVTMTRDTYCRKGAASLFPSVMYLKAGESIEVIAKNSTGDYYVANDPNHAFTQCWLWGEYTTVSGNPNDLPIYPTPALPTKTPTPTPAPDFSFEYIGASDCGGSQYYVRFFVRNPSKYTWQAMQMDLTDTTTGVSTSYSSSAFTDHSGCSVVSTQNDLTPGEDGGVSSFAAPFSAPIAGHTISVSLTVCQTDAGGCIGKSMTVTP